jgi:hypothetical protein
MGRHSRHQQSYDLRAVSAVRRLYSHFTVQVVTETGAKSRAAAITAQSVRGLDGTCFINTTFPTTVIPMTNSG